MDADLGYARTGDDKDSLVWATRAGLTVDVGCREWILPQEKNVARRSGADVVVGG